ELFFVLSGFLITGILLDTRAQTGALLKFYMRRILRIFPLYYGSLMALFWLLPLFVNFDAGAVNVQSQQQWLWLYLINFPGIDYIWDDSNLFLVGHFWSLCVEEHFYVLWPLFVFWQSRRTVMIAGAILMAVALIARASTGI